MTRWIFPGNCPTQDHPCLLFAVPPFDGEAQLTVSGQSNDDDNDFEEYGLSDSDDSKVELFVPRFCPFSSQKRARGGETRARFGDGGGEDKAKGTAVEPRNIATSSCDTTVQIHCWRPWYQ